MAFKMANGETMWRTGYCMHCGGKTPSGWSTCFYCTAVVQTQYADQRCDSPERQCDHRVAEVPPSGAMLPFWPDSRG